MRQAMKAERGGRAAAWLWPLVLLSAPGCILPEYHAAPPVNLDPGPIPTGVVFCDIEKPAARHCPMTQDEIDTGIPLNEAALALNDGRPQSDHGLDYSPDALAVCDGQPQIVPFEDLFPQGTAACIDCAAQIPAHYADAAAVCLAQCEDLTAPNVKPPDPSVVASCQARTRVSTNAADPTSCFANACGDGVFFAGQFDDPRRISEPVEWRDLVDTDISGSEGNNLTRLTAPVDPQDFNAGAASEQVITHGDAFVQFTAADIDSARLCGLAHGGPPDTEASYADIDFAIDVFKADAGATEGRFYVFEKGVKILGPGADDSFGTYGPNETFRVHIKDNLDGTGGFKPMGGTATITYSRVIGSCEDGAPCAEDPFHTSTTTTTAYPFRVDASIRDLGGSLINVRVVRIR
jgi:hypothetical protein